MDRETIWINSRRALFVIACAIIILVHSLPLRDMSLQFPAPDLIMALCFAWCLRRPQIMTPLLIAITVLAADFLLNRPPGLWALIVLGGCVYLTARQKELRQVMFGIEWAYASGTIVACFLVYYLSQFVLFLLPIDPALLSIKALITILVYPLVTFVSARLFGIRKERRIEDI